MNGNKEPLVSIIVNCYNSDRYLKETLQSIINQTYHNWEVIFWDNQSTDESAAYLKSYNEPRFKYFYAPSFEPLSTARNLAVEKAKGEYLAFLDCDDLWTEEKLSLQIPYFSDPKVGLVYSDFELILQSESKSAVYMFNSFSKMPCEQHERKNIYKKLLDSNFIIFSTIVVRKSIFNLTGGFTDKFKHNEDYEILLKASLYSDAVCIKEYATKYRIHGGNNSYQNLDASFEENRIILQSLPTQRIIKQAIYRNEVRFMIHNIIHRKKMEYIKSILFDRKMLLALVEVFQSKLSRVFVDKKLR
jgi:glycosyltransferase involved in cell wall biosynthesis